MQWKPIFFPFKYGCGIQLFYTPAWINWIFKVPDMIGHIGSTGSIAFYVPQYQLYIAGTINQKASPGLAIQIAYGLLKRVALHGFK
jgi:CubicO group peptidase (beta-lactamase class C family)